MGSYLLVSIVLAIALYIESHRAGVPQNTALGWGAITLLLGILVLPLYIWWRVRWNRNRATP